MFTGTYRMADRVFTVSSLYEDVHRLCSEYRADSAETPPDFSVTVTQADIDYEQMRSVRTAEYEHHPVREVPGSTLETLAVYRQIAEQLSAYDTVLLHGSAIAADGNAYLFTAASGTGKSTHTRLWRELLGDRAVMVNDDKPLLHIGETVTVYGTPYCGKHRLGQNIAAPLRGLCILKRGRENRIERITAEEAFPFFLQQVLRPRNAVQLAKVLTLIQRLTEQVPLYRLACNMDISAAETAFSAMSGADPASAPEKA